MRRLTRLHRRLIEAFLLGAIVIAAHERPSLAAPVSAWERLEILPSGHPAVEVSIGGSAPKRFILDTAASATTIMPRLRAAMPDLAALPSRTVMYAALGRDEVETAIIGDLEVGGQTFEELAVVLLPPGPSDRLGIDGILGADVLADYAIELDWPRRTWRMSSHADGESLSGMSAPVPIALDGHRGVRLEISIDAVRIPALLDTGANRTIMNWAAAEAIGLSRSSPRVTRTADLRAATVHAATSMAAEGEVIRVGDALIEGLEIRIVDLPAFEALGFAQVQPAMILGADAFAGRRLLIDYPRRELRVSRVPAR